MPQLRKLTITIKERKLFGSVHFGTLMKIPRTMKYNGESPMDVKILKEIIIAFLVSSLLTPPRSHSLSKQKTLRERRVEDKRSHSQKF